MLDHHATAIHVVGQVVAKRSRILEPGGGNIAEWHHNLVLLELSQGGRTAGCIEQVNYRNPWLGQYLALQLGRREGIAVDDEHVELTRYARWRWRWSRWTGLTPRRHIGRETAARQGESLGLARERLLELRALLHATSLREREWNRADGDK